MPDPWADLMPELVPIASIGLDLHDLDPKHLHESADAEPVELYAHEGRMLVHDGRHRILSAWLAGSNVVAARVLR